MGFNITSIKTSSNGVWEGDNPLDFTFPLLIFQTTLIVAFTRFLAFLLKPLRQPKVIAEILGGILLGPSALGRNKEYLNRVFPPWSAPIFETVASIGLLFFLFLVGLELDFTSIRRSGKRAFGIAVAGISLPFVSGIGVALVLRRSVDGAEKVGFPQFIVFMGVSLSITAFPVLARILAELKLLTTAVGQTAMAAAAFNDVAAWVLLALAVALSGDGESHKSPLISLWVLLSGAGFVGFMMFVIRPGMKRVATKCSPEKDVVHEAYICLTLAGVLVSGFITDMIGIHSIFGGFVFGLTIPKRGHFVEKLTERIEDFVTGLLLPLYFASSGLKTNVAEITGAEAWGLLAVVIATACAGKILGTFAVAKMCKMTTTDAVALGVLMNTKGLVELIVLNIGKQKKVLNDEIFAILVLMALFTTFITTPTVMAIYRPTRVKSGPNHRKLRDLHADDSEGQLRVLACLHGTGNIPSIISLIEATRSTKASKLKLYIMHLVQLTERSSAIIMIQRAYKNGLPIFNRAQHQELQGRVAEAFQTYSQLGQVVIRPTTAVSPLSTMHGDICDMAECKRAAMILLPFHKSWRGGEEDVQDMGHEWRTVNQRVLKHAPCSVAVLVDRGFGSGTRSVPNINDEQKVCLLFFGGPDDREALELGGRMAEHPVVKITVVRFLKKDGDDQDNNNNVVSLQSRSKSSMEKLYSFSANTNPKREKELDDAALEEFKSKYGDLVEYIEKRTNNVVDVVVEVGRSGKYDLIVVGKGRFPTSMVAEMGEQTVEHAELGPVGDILSSSSLGIKSSVLVIQEHDMVVGEKAAVKNINNADEIHKKQKGSSDAEETSTYMV